MVVYNLIIIVNPFKKTVYIKIAMNINFGNIAATKSEKTEDIRSQSFEIGLRLISRKDSHRSSVFADNVGILPEVIFEITRGIITSGCDYRINGGQSLLNPFHIKTVYSGSGIK